MLDTGSKAQLGFAVELAQLDVFRFCKIVNTATDFLGGCHLQSDLALSSLEVIRSWLCKLILLAACVVTEYGSICDCVVCAACVFHRAEST